MVDAIAIIPDEIMWAASKNMNILKVYLALNYRWIKDETFTIMLADTDCNNVCLIFDDWTTEPPEQIKFGFNTSDPPGMHISMYDRIQFTEIAYSKFQELKNGRHCTNPR